MPLLFAIVGVAALALTFVVLVGPVLLVIGVVGAIRARRYSKVERPEPQIVAGDTSRVDAQTADAAFADLFSWEWPEESATLWRL